MIAFIKADFKLEHSLGSKSKLTYKYGIRCTGADKSLRHNISFINWLGAKISRVDSLVSTVGVWYTCTIV